MKRLALTLTLLVFALSVWPLRAASRVEAASPTTFGAQQSTAAPADAQAVIAQADVLLKQARETGASYANNKDEPSKKATKKALEEAEKLMKDALKRDPSCEKCTEHLARAYLYKSYFGFEKDYDDCLKVATQGLTRFPANAMLAYIKGVAHYNSGEYAEAVRALNRYIAGTTNDPKGTAQAQQLMQDSQQRFMNSWYKHADFYQSKDSRIETMGPGFKKVTLFQVTPQWELQLGGQAFTAVTNESPTLQDQEIQTYIEGLVQRLTSKTPGPSFAYKVTVLKSPAVNAMTVPGHVFVNLGLFAFAESESEFVGVLAHEMGHNYGHHAGRRFIKAVQAQQWVNLAASMVNPQNQMAQLATQLAGQIGVQLFILAYSRGEEKEADLYGAHLMYNAGYDPTALSMFFTKMYKANPKQPVRFLSTHPPVPERAAYLIDYTEAFPLGASEVKTDSADFQKIRARVLAAMQTAPGPQAPGKAVLPPQ
jgi:predicted Zn-dependent protease